MKTLNNMICPLCRINKPINPTIKIDCKVYLKDTECLPYLCKDCFNLLQINNLTIMFECDDMDRFNEIATINITGNHHILKRDIPHVITYYNQDEFKKQLTKYKRQIH